MVKEYIEKNRMICSGDKILIGVSGGADSVCLLRILLELSKDLGFQIGAVHVNHQIRKEAVEDATFVQALCRELGIPCEIKSVDVVAYARKNHLSSEEAGRILRYQIFEEKIKTESYNKVAVAHHADDNAETMLLNLFRGTGLSGLTGIKAVRDEVIRPLLCLSRQNIEEYLEQIGQPYCIDATNQTDYYTRNKVRNHILPYIQKEIAPQVVTRMNETAMQLTELREFLERQTDQYYESCVKFEEKSEAYIVDLDFLMHLDSVIQKEIFLRCLEKLTPHKKDITSRHINALMELCDSDYGKELHLPYQIQVKKIYNQLMFSKVEKGDLDSVDTKKNENYELSHDQLDRLKEQPMFVDWNQMMQFQLRVFAGDAGQNIPRNEYTKWFDYDKIRSSVAFRNRMEGDYFTFDSDGHRKTLKSYMINEKIPRDKREKMCVIAEGSHILWLPGYRISEYYKVDQGTRHILEICIQEDKNG